MPKIVSLFLLIVFGGTGLSVPAGACGPDTDCLIGERTYRIRMPLNHDGVSKVGAIIFNHGYRGTAKGLMRNKRLGKLISDMGLAFVAPKSARQDWDIPNAPSPGPRSELPFFDALKARLVDQHSIDPKRIVVSGFSAGGMMTWNLACDRGDQFAGFVPVSGTFWAPVPKNCSAMPAHIIHVHGTSDKIVPMKGCPIASTKQGDIYRALKLAAKQGDYGPWRSQGSRNGLTCQQKISAKGIILQLCLHPGGHSFRSVWLKDAWNTLEKAGAFN